MDMQARRMIVLAAAAWVPLVVLMLLTGRAVSGGGILDVPNLAENESGRSQR